MRINAQELSFLMDSIYDIVDKGFNAIDDGKIYDDMVNRIEKIVIIKALERSYGNQVEASRILGLHRNTLHSKILKFGIEARSFKK